MPWRALGPMLAGLGILYVVGIGFGVPSRARQESAFLPSQLNDDFFRKVEANRRGFYERVGENIQAAAGRKLWSGALLPPSDGFQIVRHKPGPEPGPLLMHAFSSFSLRSVEQDESNVLNGLARFKPRQLQFDPKMTLYGGAYLYPLAGFLGVLHVGGFLKLVGDPLFYYRDPDRMGRLYVGGRLLTALFGLGAVVMVFLLGRELYGERAGLWAAFLFGTAPGVFPLTHVMKLHLPGAFWALACLLFCARFARTKRQSELVKAAALFGLAVGTAKYLAVLAAPCAAAYWLGHADPLSPRRLGRLALLGLLSVGVFLLVNPYFIASWSDFRDESKEMFRWYQSSPSLKAVLEFLLQPARAGVGTPAWALALMGCAWAGRRRAFADKLILLFLLTTLVLTAFQFASSAGTVQMSRFFFPGLALLCVLGAAWALEQKRQAGMLVLAVAAVFNLSRAVLTDVNFWLDRPGYSNAWKAAEWIEANLPPGASIGMQTPAPMTDRFPPVKFSRYELVYSQGPLEGREASLPEYYVTQADWVPQEVAARYAPLATFDRLPWFRDPFTEANYPIVVLRRRPA